MLGATHASKRKKGERKESNRLLLNFQSFLEGVKWKENLSYENIKGVVGLAHQKEML